MNIFVLDKDITFCAQYHCDKHVVKQILETTQLLCTAHHIWGTEDVPYRKTHYNHPCAIWTRESKENYLWTLEFGISLCGEYTYRYGKVHKCVSVLDWCLNHPPLAEKLEFTPFALAMPDEYKCDDPVQSYRNYYNGAKRHLFKWTKREVPEWIKEV